MRNEFELLKKKIDAVASLESDAAQLRDIIGAREHEAAKEYAAAIVEGRELPKRDKKHDADRVRLAELDAAIPHANELISVAAMKLRNDLAALLASGQERKSRMLNLLKADLKKRMDALTVELGALEDGPESRMHSTLAIGNALLVSISPIEIFSLAQELFSQHEDFLTEPPEKPAAIETEKPSEDKKK